MTEVQRFASMCSIPRCSAPRKEGCLLCEDHMELGYMEDYNHYRDLIEEGHTSYQAGVLSGLLDPDS